MTPERLDELIARFSTLRIAIIGDFFLDRYLDTDPGLIEHSVESGRAAHQVTGIRRSAGAAGTVVNNLAALGTGSLLAVGAVGNDGEAWDLARCLETIGCRTEHLHRCDTLMTPTYLKPRDATDPSLAGEHERYDTRNRSATPGGIIETVVASLDAVLPGVDAVVVADQIEMDDCGVITAEMRDVLSQRARAFPDIVFWVDSRTHIQLFRDLIIKPNQFEAVDHDLPRPDDRVPLEEVLAALPRLKSLTGKPVVVTLGERGMLASDPVPEHVPGVRLDGELDPTGAGDSATAGCVLALAAGSTLAEAALVGNLVASITVEQLAVTGTADPDQVRERLRVWRGQNGLG